MTKNTGQVSLPIRPLSSEAFAPYGDVLEASADKHHFTINDGYTERFHDLAQIDVADENGRAIVSIFRSTPLTLPIKIEMMERHPLGSQAFMPLSQQPYLVVVAPKGAFDKNNIEVFLAQPTQGVNYHKGTWHHFCLALNHECDFLVIDRSGEGNNCDVETLDGSLVINLEGINDSRT
ncbi:ureidoglycolate lyase [Aliiglaciecola litoralis]|uniref:Ureidoglycolate lyase n=1 Tax=Aliiglaciecola litoralis TaxID=582857 RepID=A0ABP3WP47_9ALTE